MSRSSPRPVADGETLARFVFHSVHWHKKTGLKSSLFSQAHKNGCSIQRESLAEDSEIIRFLLSYLAKNSSHTWLGVVTGPCIDVRKITNDVAHGRRTVCVFDTAQRPNPAHAELCQTRYIINEADENELRAQLLRAFNSKTLIKPTNYRGGRIFQSLPPSIQQSVQTMAKKLGI
jgi:hypothetical protein